MSYARALFLALAVAGGCAGETFDLLPAQEMLPGDGGAAGKPGVSAGNGGSAGKDGVAGTTAFPPPDGGTSFPYCQKHEDCGLGACLQQQGYPGRCVECIDEDDCSRDKNCDPLTNSCETACIPSEDSEELNPDCPRSRPQCSDFRNGVCVACLNDGHCTLPNAKRCAWDNRCVQCRTSRHCSNPAPFCQTSPTPNVPAFTCRSCRTDLECLDNRNCIGGSCVAAEPSPEP